MLALFFFRRSTVQFLMLGTIPFGEVRSDPISNAGTILSAKYGQIQSLMLALIFWRKYGQIQSLMLASSFFFVEVRSDPVSDAGTIFGGEVR